MRDKRFSPAPLQRLLVWLSAAAVFALLLFLAGHILGKGLPHLKLSLFSWDYSSSNLSLLPALLNTLYLVLMTLLMAVPAGVGGAIYLTEYAKSSRLSVRLIRLTAETLSGIPSIVYGLFGFLFFVLTLHMGNSLPAGALTLAIMVLPTILRTTEEALKSVPLGDREGSYGLGAGKLRTVFRIVLPSAMPGISAGIILATGRIVGETAALIYTAGTVTGRVESLRDSGRSLAVHLYCLLNEGLHMEEAYATAVILLLLVIGINALANAAAKRLSKG